MPRSIARRLALAAVLAVAAAPVAQAQFVRTNAGFAATVTPRNDDTWFGPIATGFAMNVGGVLVSSINVSNNGVAWMNGNGFAYLYVLNADLDTRNGATRPMTYGTSTIGGRAAFGVNWFDIGYYSYGGPAMSFQLVLIDRSDVAAGAFDVEYNYGSMDGAWHGTVGRYTSAGNWSAPQSNVPQSLRDLEGTRYALQGRNGTISNGAHVVSAVPEPGTWALLATGLVGVAGAAVRRRTA